MLVVSNAHALHASVISIYIQFVRPNKILNCGSIVNFLFTERLTDMLLIEPRPDGPVKLHNQTFHENSIIPGLSSEKAGLRSAHFQAAGFGECAGDGQETRN